MDRGFPAWSCERAGLCYLCSSLPLPPAPVLSSEHELLSTQENPRQTHSQSPGFSLVSSFLVPCPVNFICLWFPGPTVPSPQLRKSTEFPDLLIPAPQARNSLPAMTGVTKGLVSFVSCHSEITFPVPLPAPHHIQCLIHHCSSFWLSHVGG